jgi:Cdc6-like AAA superfamily ATPase
VSEIKDAVAQVSASQINAVKQSVLHWITDITYGNEHSDVRNKRLPKTSEWLLETEEYHGWVNNSGKTLYYEGMPGAGKTIMASVIVDDLDRSQKENGKAYIYCNYKREETQTVENLLKTMLRQLLQSRPLLPESVKSLYDEQKSRQTQPTLEEIRRLLRSTVASYPRVFIVIDALDECIGPDDCRSRYLQEIQELQKVYAVNVLATSRPLPEVRKMPPFKNSPLVQLQALDEDIQVYLDYRISKFPSFVQLDIDLQRAIKDKIHGIVNGMYVYRQ